MDAFTRAYIECALWSSTDGGDEPLERRFDARDIAPEELARMEADCAAFQDANPECSEDPERAGMDFWLTRNGHGAGFWDGDWPEPAASRLTAAADAYGYSDFYIGDDGRLHLYPSA